MGPDAVLPVAPVRVAGHQGAASFQLRGQTYGGTANFFLPAAGNALAAFRPEGDAPPQDFGSTFSVEGEHDGQRFRIACEQIFVHEAANGLTLISPVNGPARVYYGESPQLPARRAVVALDNFDFQSGDAVGNDHGWTRIGTPLRVSTGDRYATFRHRPDRPQLLQLAQAGFIRSASLVEIEFAVNDNEPDDVLLRYAADLADICTVARGAGVTAALMDLRDESGALLRRVIPQPITARYRDVQVVDDEHLAPLFAVAFPEFRRMKQAHPAWERLANQFGHLESVPFMEQKLTSLMTAIEFFLRNALLERGIAASRVASLNLPGLVGASRTTLGWNIPRHYTTNDAVRSLRNALAHGEAPTLEGGAELRRLFDKWKLLAFRLALIRLGYDGTVVSPRDGYWARSAVGDMAEENNSFLPADPSKPDAWEELRRRLRQVRNSGTSSISVRLHHDDE